MYSQFVSNFNAILFRIRSLEHVELEQDFSSHSNTSNIILSWTWTRLYFELGRTSNMISIWTGKQFCFELERNFMSISSNAIWFRIRTHRTITYNLQLERMFHVKLERPIGSETRKSVFWTHKRTSRRSLEKTRTHISNSMYRLSLQCSYRCNSAIT
jgi:hypothetical protein